MSAHKSFHFVGDDGRVVRVATESALNGLRSRGPGVVVVACAGDIRTGILSIVSRIGTTNQTDESAFAAIRHINARTRVTQGRGNLLASLTS